MVDVLSQREGIAETEEALKAMISFPNPKRVEELKAFYKDSKGLQKIIGGGMDNSCFPKAYQLQHKLFIKNGRIIVLAQSPFKAKVLHFIYQEPMVGHMGYLKTY